MLEERNKGSVYQQWHGAILPNYTMILHSLISLLNKLPRSAFFITEQDVQDLRLLASAFEVDLIGEDLKNPKTYHEIIGLLKKKAKEAAEKELRPTDPYAQVINTLKENDVRAMEGEKV